MRIIKVKRDENGELPSLEGHTKQCVYGINADGSDSLICVCPPTEVVEEVAKKVEAPVTAPVKPEFYPRHKK